MVRLLPALLCACLPAVPPQVRADAHGNASGLLCGYAIAVSMEAWGRACRPDDPGLEPLGRVVETFRSAVGQADGWDDESISAFEAQMRGDVKPKDCIRADLVPMGEAILAEPDALLAAYEALLDQDHPPAFGACL